MVKPHMKKTKFMDAVQKILERLGLEGKTQKEIEFCEDYLYPEYLRGQD